MGILITGGCGFIGSGFCRRILKQHPYLKLVNIDCLYPCSTVSDDLLDSKGNYTFIKGNLNTLDLDSIMNTYNIDIVIHFAAQSHVDTSFTNPLIYTKDNIMGTHMLLEASRKWGKIKKFIQISTDEVYGENTNTVSAFTETSLLKPTNPYAASKASAEMLVHSYMHSYNLPAVIIRSNNIYGPGQYPEKVLPKFLFQLIDKKKLTIQGSGCQLRSFLYIEDVIDAILCIMFQGEIGQIYNISSTDEISILALAEKLVALLMPGEKMDNWIEFIEDRNFNDKRYWIESNLLHKLGWKQQWSLDRGLVETVRWFQQVDRLRYWSTTRRKALIWGSNGWIGKQFQDVLLRKGWEVVSATSRSQNRLDVSREIDIVQPTHIVSLIGRTHGPGFTTIDYLEQSGKLHDNIQDNLYGPITLASIAKSKGLHMMYMGTGCIFEYDDIHTLDKDSLAFREEDVPNFFGSSYSVVKGFTDRIMSEEYGNTCLNVRIRMPISKEDCPRNFITKILSYKKICSIPNSMTVLDDILPCLADSMDRGITGTLNAVNPGVIEHDTILSWYREFQNVDHTWESITTDTLVGSCVKAARSNNRLDTTRIQSLFPNIPSIDTSVRNILQTCKFLTNRT
jgi:UDP-glucose 4,6-dehydratase